MEVHLVSKVFQPIENLQCNDEQVIKQCSPTMIIVIIITIIMILMVVATIQVGMLNSAVLSLSDCCSGCSPGWKATSSFIIIIIMIMMIVMIMMTMIIMIMMTMIIMIMIFQLLTDLLSQVTHVKVAQALNSNPPDHDHQL